MKLRNYTAILFTGLLQILALYGFASGDPARITGLMEITDLSAPSNLSARPVSETEVRLEWKSNSSKHKGFRIERSQSRNGGFAQIAEVDKKTTSIHDKKLKPGTTYYYRVRAFGKKKEVSEFSNIAEATTPASSAISIPAVPANLVAKAVSSTQIDLSWTNQSSNDKGVKIERSQSATDGFAEIAVVSKGGAFYTNHGLNPNTQYFYRIRSYNDAGHSGYSNTASAMTGSGNSSNPLLVKSHNFPTYYTAGSTTEAASITLTEGAQVSKVEAYFKGITQSEWRLKEITPSAGNEYQLRFHELDLDEIGFNYYFKIISPMGTSISSEQGFTHITYPNSGVQIPDLQFGSTAANYQMISIPLELKNKAIAAVLEDDLGEYDKRKWRFGHYNGDTVKEYKEGLDNIEPGKSYWLIVRKKNTVNTGEGSTFQVRSETPFTMQLKAGWNQIGNPYSFNVLWEDVVNSSKPAKLGELYVYEGGYKQSDVLRRFSGGFVYAESPVKLVFPVLKSSGINAKRTLEVSPPALSNEQWMVSLHLSAGDISYSLGGVGMHPLASLGKDEFDLVALPRFGEFAEVAVNHPEHTGKRFTRDVVPTTEGHMWEIEASSSFVGQTHTISWDNRDWGDNNKQLWLLDRENQQVVNMREKNSYSFKKEAPVHRFKIFFGDEAFINEHLHPEKIILLPAFPNPFVASTTFHFTIPPAWGESRVSLKVYNLQGQEVAQLAEARYGPGFHSLKWDGTNKSGELLISSTYIYKLMITNDTEDVSQTGKIVISR